MGQGNADGLSRSARRS